MGGFFSSAMRAVETCLFAGPFTQTVWNRINNKTEHFVQQWFSVHLELYELKIVIANVLTVMEQNITFLRSHRQSFQRFKCIFFLLADRSFIALARNRVMITGWSGVICRVQCIALQTSAKEKNPYWNKKHGFFRLNDKRSRFHWTAASPCVRSKKEKKPKCIEIICYCILLNVNTAFLDSF